MAINRHTRAIKNAKPPGPEPTSKMLRSDFFLRNPASICATKEVISYTPAVAKKIFCFVV